MRCALLLILCLASPALAEQTPWAAEDPVAEAPIRVGALGIRPRIGIRDFGVDTNVFNTQVDPQRDLTLTVVPGAQVFLRTGRGLLTLDGGADLVYFQEFDSERSVNSRASFLYEFRFNRFRPFGGFNTLNTRERPGFEIDVRARRYESQALTGMDVRIASKSLVRAEVKRTKYSFAGDAVFGGRPLNQSLSRNLQVFDLSWRQRLTSVTTWVTRASVESERFDLEPLRDSNTVRINTGFELGRLALIRGSAFVGYRKLTAATGSVIPAFSSATADVNVSYTAPSQTRVTSEVKRDIQYSFDLLTPYYIQTGWTVTLTQRVIGRWDVKALGGRDRLSYQGVVDQLDRRDFVGRWGGGIGYTLGGQVRLGFDVNSFHRSSDIPGREYGGLRSGISVTYGY